MIGAAPPGMPAPAPANGPRPGGDPAPTFSILIGLVSTEDSDRILETLASLRAQDGAPRHEVILADRRQDAVSARIRAEHPEAVLIPCPPGTPLPEMRAIALDRARGAYVAVTEDHCVPTRDWLLRMEEAFRAAPAGTAAVGGCVENGVCDTSLDWATFLCEYSGLIAPVPDGPARALPGMNVAYRRDVLAGLDRALLTSGFWETTVHPVLAARGQVLYSANAVRMLHKKRFSFGLFAAQRFLYSRYYAGRRFGRAEAARRWAACAMTLALPPLLLFRIARGVLAKRRLRGELASALPHLGVFVLIWAAGEMAGYALGPGDALSRIE